MREIKFKFWNEKSKIMYDEFPDYLDGYDLEMIFNKDSNGGLIPMQFTGLKDKNGQEIYEGDVCEIIYNNRGKISQEITPVLWGSYNDGEYVDNVECWMVGWYPLSDIITNPAYSIEVIGNIYKNPELLKGVKK